MESKGLTPAGAPGPCSPGTPCAHGAWPCTEPSGPRGSSSDRAQKTRARTPPGASSLTWPSPTYRTAILCVSYDGIWSRSCTDRSKDCSHRAGPEPRAETVPCLQPRHQPRQVPAQERSLATQAGHPSTGAPVGQPQEERRQAYLAGQKDGLVGLVTEERGVVELQEHEAAETVKPGLAGTAQARGAGAKASGPQEPPSPAPPTRAPQPALPLGSVLAHLGLMPGTFSVLGVLALPLKASLSTRLPLRDGAESEMV